MRKRFVTVLAMSVVAVLATPGTTYARDCCIASRSAQGNAGATDSSRWITSSAEDFAHSPDFRPALTRSASSTLAVERRPRILHRPVGQGYR